MTSDGGNKKKDKSILLKANDGIHANLCHGGEWHVCIVNP